MSPSAKPFRLLSHSIKAEPDQFRRRRSGRRITKENETQAAARPRARSQRRTLPEARPDVSAHGEIQPLPQPPQRVLCVEDNEDISFLLYTVLKREGYDAVVTYTVGDALTLAGREEFDLYVLDVLFEKGGSGLDLCRTLREAHPNAPVVFYSAAAFDSDREAALRAGACAYVTKPGIEELVEAVRRALAAG